MVCGIRKWYMRPFDLCSGAPHFSAAADDSGVHQASLAARSKMCAPMSQILVCVALWYWERCVLVPFAEELCSVAQT